MHWFQVEEITSFHFKGKNLRFNSFPRKICLFSNILELELRKFLHQYTSYYQQFPVIISFSNSKTQMGNCVLDQSDRKIARKGFQFKESNCKRAHLNFKVKTWPHLQKCDLQDTENCVERSFYVSLSEDEEIGFNLKGKPEASLIAKSFDFSLQCQISKLNKHYKIKFPIEQQKSFLWRFISDWTNIENDDIVLIGKTIYKLLKFQSGLAKNNDLDFFQTDGQTSFFDEVRENRQCRICFSSNDSKQNPLFSACKCSGSIQYTHKKCFVNWNFKCKQDTNNLKMKIKNTNCEICHADVTTSQEFQELKKEIGIFKMIKGPYAIFQIYQGDQEKNQNFIILQFQNKKQFTIGRNKTVDISITNDTFVSKQNSKILFKNNSLLINDAYSTPGTFLKMQKDIILDSNHKKYNIEYRNMVIKAQYSPSLDI